MSHSTSKPPAPTDEHVQVEYIGDITPLIVDKAYDLIEQLAKDLSPGTNVFSEKQLTQIDTALSLLISICPQYQAHLKRIQS